MIKFDCSNIPFKLQALTGHTLQEILANEKALPQIFSLFMTPQSTMSMVYRVVLKMEYEKFCITELTRFVPQNEQLVAVDHLWSYLSDNLRLCYAQDGQTFRDTLKLWEDRFLHYTPSANIQIDTNMFPTFKHFDVLPPIRIDLNIPNSDVVNSAV